MSKVISLLSVLAVLAVSSFSLATDTTKTATADAPAADMQQSTDAEKTDTSK